MRIESGPQTTTYPRLGLFSDACTRYAHDVVSGRIVAGKIVIAACARHLDDLKHGSERGLVWDVVRAKHALEFFPACLSITTGTAEGQPFHLLPWHAFVVGSLFGWRRESGRLRFKRAWIETGKGMGKSPIMAAIGLYMTCFYGIQRAEVYAIGQDRNVANILFRDAVAMCRAPMPDTNPDDGISLETTGEVVLRGNLDNTHKIEHGATNSIFRSLANGEAISGPRPTAVLADEIHEFKSSAPLETWARAIAKMPTDSIMILGTNTPASTQLVGTTYSEFFQRVVKGQIKDDEAFAYIARVDEEDYENVFDNEDCWPKALPALDVTFPRENIRGEVATAKVLLSTSMSVKRLYFGIPSGSIDFWIEETAWADVQGVVDLERMRGFKCWLSLDLSQKNDLTALTMVWRDNDGHLWAYTWYWTTKAGLDDRVKRDVAPYDEWIEKGYLEAVPGSVISKEFVAAKAAELASKYDIEFMAFDPAGIDDFIKACDEVGFPVWKWEGDDKPAGRGLKLISHAQGTRVRFEGKQLCMPRSIERFEDYILEKRITIAESPVTYSCAANAVVQIDAQKNRAFDKKRSRGRIDGIVTLAMAVGSATGELVKEPKYQMIVVG